MTVEEWFCVCILFLCGLFISIFSPVRFGYMMMGMALGMFVMSTRRRKH